MSAKLIQMLGWPMAAGVAAVIRAHWVVIQIKRSLAEQPLPQASIPDFRGLWCPAILDLYLEAPSPSLPLPSFQGAYKTCCQWFPIANPPHVSTTSRQGSNSCCFLSSPLPLPVVCWLRIVVAWNGAADWS